MIADDLRELLGERIPAGHTRQVLADDWIPRLAEAGPRVMDLGCGAGDSVDAFRPHVEGLRWVGVDLPASPEVDERTRTDVEFRTFDGLAIPAADGEFDSVYCKQVLEHVEQPGPLLADVARVLRPGGLFAGSVSQLEPFHSLSVGNMTPYGLMRLAERSGLELLEVRPGIDALTLIVHRGLGFPAFTRRYWSRESPLNRAIGLFGRARRLDAQRVNAIKLLFCGQFAFLARRP
jgi:SAM-dependent methyltransferase